jgi:hypothetical protein
MRTNSISTGRLCGNVFASDIAAMHTGAGGHANDFKQLETAAMPMTLSNIKRSAMPMTSCKT